MLTDNLLNEAVCCLIVVVVCGLLCKAWRFFAVCSGLALLLLVCFTFFWMNGGNWGFPLLDSVSATAGRLSAVRVYEVVPDDYKTSGSLILETLISHLLRIREYVVGTGGGGGWSLLG